MTPDTADLLKAFLITLGVCAVLCLIAADWSRMFDDDRGER